MASEGWVDSSSATPDEAVEAGKTHVLVVEDEPQLQAFMRWQLEDAGFATSGAADGYEALKLIEATKPDLVLLDLMMPYMDGWAVLEELRQWPTMPPVIITSALGLNAQRQRAWGMGASGYLVKPFLVEQLVEEIERILPGGAQQQARG
jgi:DNA-binding response OmpR family regulator